MGHGKTISRECNHKIQGNSKNVEAAGLKKEEEWGRVRSEKEMNNIWRVCFIIRNGDIL